MLYYITNISPCTAHVTVRYVIQMYNNFQLNHSAMCFYNLWLNHVIAAIVMCHASKMIICVCVYTCVIYVNSDQCMCTLAMYDPEQSWILNSP